MTAAQPLHDSILDAWGMGIIAGAYPPGARIALDDAVTGFKASRTVSREAVRVLESMGLVTVRRRVGATVNPPERWNSFDPRIIAWRLRGPDRIAQLHALAELRLAVEPVAARLAASRAAPEHRARLTEGAIGLAAHSHEADGAAYLAADVLFHRALLDASGNVMFAALGGVVEAVLAGRTRHGLMPVAANPVALRLHTEVATAVQSRDADGAERAMREIVTEADRAVDSPRGRPLEPPSVS
jgi:DNA-binding FadR family transcriptional regulator